MTNTRKFVFLKQAEYTLELFGALQSSDLASYTRHSSGLAGFLTYALKYVEMSAPLKQA